MRIFNSSTRFFTCGCCWNVNASSRFHLDPWLWLTMKVVPVSRIHKRKAIASKELASSSSSAPTYFTPYCASFKYPAFFLLAFALIKCLYLHTKLGFNIARTTAQIFHCCAQLRRVLFVDQKHCVQWWLYGVVHFNTIHKCLTGCAKKHKIMQHCWFSLGHHSINLITSKLNNAQQYCHFRHFLYC